MGEDMRWFSRAYRRFGWLAQRPSSRKVFNIGLNAFAFAIKAKRLNSYPSMLKIDISPMCALACPTCVHADAETAGVEEGGLLSKQKFSKNMMMSVEQFAKIIDEVKGKATSVSLFYYGDPLIHPSLDKLCAIAASAHLNVHYTTHFSYCLSDERIASIARSGVSHITVAVDGAKQETYEITRIGGRLDFVLSNLERLARYKRENGLKYPKIEVQTLRFPHQTPGEFEQIRAIVNSFGIDQFSSFDGVYLDPAGRAITVESAHKEALESTEPLPKNVIPKCYWPYSAMVIKYNGDVIPCCMHKVALQHTEREAKAVVGNVFASDVKQVWDSKNYQNIRRLVCDPSLADRDALFKENFCYGCNSCFKIPETSKNDIVPVS